MFRKEYLDEFYNLKINPEFEVSIEVKKHILLCLVVFVNMLVVFGIFI